MSAELTGKRIAILATDGVEGVELTSPREALEQAGATVEILAPKDGSIQLWDHDEKSTTRHGRPDGLRGRPGGVRRPRAPRRRTQRRPPAHGSGLGALRHRARPAAASPIGVICHGGWILIEAGAVNGTHDDLVPVTAHRPAERGRALGGRGGRQRPRTGLEPAAGRPPGVQRQDRRGVRRGPARAQGGLTPT